MLPKVSVIIPFYNCPYVGEAIRSVLAQTYKNIELVIVNDGSTRFSELITPYVHLENVKYIEKQNGGTASALNMGIRNATGQLIAWLSSDDVFAISKIEEQVNFMIQNNAFISYTNFNFIDATGQIIQANAGMHIEDQLSFLRYMLRGCIVNGSTVLIKRGVFDSIGLFEESLRYAQDYDFWLRAAHHYRLYSLNQTLLNYRVHDNMGSNRHRPEQDREAQIVKDRYFASLNQIINSML